MDNYSFEWIAKENEEISALLNFVTPKQSSRDHRHEFYEFSYILGGTGYHSVDNVDYEVRAGDLVFVNPKEVHQVYTKDFFTNDGKLLYVDVYVSTDFVESHLRAHSVLWNILTEMQFERNDGQTVKVAPVIHISDDEQEFISNIFMQLYKEYAEKGPYYQDIMKNLFLVIANTMVRSFEKSNGKVINNIGTIPRTAIEYIDQHYNENITLKQVAAMVYMQPANFCKQFKKYYKVSFLKYIHKRRIETAIDLIKRGDPNLRICDISERVGYSNRQQFYKYFHSIVGCTPSDYRKRLRRDEKEEKTD